MCFAVHLGARVGCGLCRFLSIGKSLSIMRENRIKFRFNWVLKECLCCVNLCFIFGNYFVLDFQKSFDLNCFKFFCPQTQTAYKVGYI